MKHYDLKRYQWAIIEAFIKTKRGKNCIIMRQHLPEAGVWIDVKFYSASYLISQFEAKKDLKQIA